MSRISKYRSAALVAAALALAAQPVQAGPGDEPAPGWTPVASATLDGARGGFETASGLNLSLGIERVVSVNGEVLSRTSVDIPNLGNITAEQAAQAHEVLSSARLVQLGANNFVAPEALGSGATLIQNTLDHQTIRAQTVISSTVNSMSMLKDLNFLSTVRDALVRSAGSL